MLWGPCITTDVVPPEDPRLTGNLRLRLADRAAGASAVNALVQFGVDALWQGDATLEWKGLPWEGTIFTWRLRYYEAISHALLWDSTPQSLDEAGQEVNLAFDLQLHAMKIAMQIGEEPTRHAGVAHTDELSIRESWLGDADAWAEATWGSIAHTMVAGTAFGTRQGGLKPHGRLEFTHQAGVAGDEGRFSDLVFFGRPVPGSPRVYAADASEDIDGWYDVSYG